MKHSEFSLVFKGIIPKYLQEYSNDILEFLLTYIKTEVSKGNILEIRGFGKLYLQTTNSRNYIIFKAFDDFLLEK